LKLLWPREREVFFHERKEEERKAGEGFVRANKRRGALLLYTHGWLGSLSVETDQRLVKNKEDFYLTKCVIVCNKILKLQNLNDTNIFLTKWKLN
jgi:hypothetical protein